MIDLLLRDLHHWSHLFIGQDFPVRMKSSSSLVRNKSTISSTAFSYPMTVVTEYALAIDFFSVV